MTWSGEREGSDSERSNASHREGVVLPVGSFDRRRTGWSMDKGMADRVSVREYHEVGSGERT